LLPSEPAIPAALPDFVLANLSGSTPSMELTNAGATSALDHTTLDWHYPLIERLGLGALQWPIIRPFGTVAAVITVDGHQLPCYTPVGDHQCALVGAFLGGNELSLNISTGSQASMITPQLQFGQCQTRPFFDGRFLNTITGVPAGRALNVLMNLLTELARAQQLTLADPWGYVAAAAEQVEQTDLAVNLAFYDSMGGKEGSISHIREDNLAAGQLFHAAFQNMADNYLLAAQRMAALPSAQQLVFSGGLAQKIGVLRAMIQRKFGLPYRVCASAEDALLGLLALALVASGRFARVGQATDYLLANYHE
jgi:sugar (pentulose or hexulose) kinase